MSNITGDGERGLFIYGAIVHVVWQAGNDNFDVAIMVTVIASYGVARQYRKLAYISGEGFPLKCCEAPRKMLGQAIYKIKYIIIIISKVRHLGI